MIEFFKKIFAFLTSIFTQKKPSIVYPKFGDTDSKLVRELQAALNRFGVSPKVSVDGDFGPKTKAALIQFKNEYGLRPSRVVNSEVWERLGLSGEKKESPPWYTYALKFKGKKETDPEFAKFMVPKWKMLGLSLKTISANYAAWCGLAMAVALGGVGLDYQKNGALAKNWEKFGIEVNWKAYGVPQGAIVRINHSGDCKSAKSNHVAQANGDCTAAELNAPGAYIDLYGGNQGNSWKVSSFPAKHICNVRWPKDYKKPGPIAFSHNCSKRNNKGESTR